VTGATGRTWPGDGALQAADGYYRILGRIDDFINLAGHRLGTKEIESASLLVEEIAEGRELGPIARPRRVVIVPDMPKTRSGKIMRRVLGAISNNEDAGDISTLANPEIVDEIRKIKA